MWRVHPYTVQLPLCLFLPKATHSTTNHKQKMFHYLDTGDHLQFSVSTYISTQKIYHCLFLSFQTFLWKVFPLFWLLL